MPGACFVQTNRQCEGDAGGDWTGAGTGSRGHPLTPLRLLALCVLAELLSGYLLVLTLFSVFCYCCCCLSLVLVWLLLPLSWPLLLVFICFATGFGCLMKRKYNILVCGQILYIFSLLLSCICY